MLALRQPVVVLPRHAARHSEVVGRKLSMPLAPPLLLTLAIAAALVGGDQRIVEWHENAMNEALDAGQEYTQARLGGNHGSLTTGNWAVAIFLHDTARPVGRETPAPHLHSHAVVFNMTLGDKIRSVQAAEIYRVQSLMS